MSVLEYSPLAQALRETGGGVSSAATNPRMFAPLSSGQVRDTPLIGKILKLPQVPDARGNLTFIEGARHVPFDIKRVFYLYDVPGGASRGGHGHRALHQFIIAMAGSFDITLDNTKDVERFSLNRAYYGLYVPPMTWAELENFSSGAVCLVLASEVYNESDYFRDYNVYRETVEGMRT